MAVSRAARKAKEQPAVRRDRAAEVASVRLLVKAAKQAAGGKRAEVHQHGKRLAVLPYEDLEALRAFEDLEDEIDIREARKRMRSGARYVPLAKVLARLES